jgi:hypothetical protein
MKTYIVQRHEDIDFEEFDSVAVQAPCEDCALQEAIAYADYFSDPNVTITEVEATKRGVIIGSFRGG